MHLMDFKEFFWALDMLQGAIDKVRRCIRERASIGESLFSTFIEFRRQYMIVGGMPTTISSFTETNTFSGLGRCLTNL